MPIRVVLERKPELEQTDIKNSIEAIFPADVAETSTDRFLGILDRLMENGREEIIVDCSKLGRVTSSHINILWQARLKCIDMNVSMKLGHVTPELIRVLKVLDLYDIFLSDKKDIAENTQRIKIPPPDSRIGNLELDFMATVEGIEDTLKEFRRFLRKISIPRLIASELETVYYEVATNIRLHGKGDPAAPANFSALSDVDKITMRFKYFGQAFDPVAHQEDFDPRSVAAQRKKRGYGLVMIKRMTDSMSYQREENNINLLILEKRWRFPNE